MCPSLNNRLNQSVFSIRLYDVLISLFKVGMSDVFLLYTSATGEHFIDDIKHTISYESVNTFFYYHMKKGMTFQLNKRFTKDVDFG